MTDMWSQEPEQLVAAYEGVTAPPGAIPLPAEYADYAENGQPTE